MKILVCGCIHSRFDVVVELQKQHTPDLCILLGDLQTFFNEQDMADSFLPKKYEKMGTFTDLATGKIALQCPTIAIGGNHEAPRVVWSLQKGGFLLKNLYYVGTSVVDVVIRNQLVTVCGISGISHKPQSFPILKQPFLKQRFSHEQKQMAVHHSYELFDQLVFPEKKAIYLSHDWPRGITTLINKKLLVSPKTNLCDETIGSPLAARLFYKVCNQQSVFWCAHMHKNVEQFVNFPGKQLVQTLQPDDLQAETKSETDLQINSEQKQSKTKFVLTTEPTQNKAENLQNPDLNQAEKICHGFSKTQQRFRFCALGRVWEQGFEVVSWDAEKTDLGDGVYKLGQLKGQFDKDWKFELGVLNKNGKMWLKVGDEELELK